MTMRNFTDEELATYKAELLKFKSPWLTRVIYGAWFSFGRYSIFPIFVGLLALMIIDTYVKAWQMFLIPIIKYIAFFLIFGVGGLMLISYLLEYWKITATRKQLGLTLEEWNYLIELFNITIDGTQS